MDTNTIPPPPKHPLDGTTIRKYEVGPQGGYFKGQFYKEHDVISCTEAQASRTWVEMKRPPPPPPVEPDTEPKTMHGAQQHKK